MLPQVALLALEEAVLPLPATTLWAAEAATVVTSTPENSPPVQGLIGLRWVEVHGSLESLVDRLSSSC